MADSHSDEVACGAVHAFVSRRRATVAGPACCRLMTRDLSGSFLSVLVTCRRAISNARRCDPSGVLWSGNGCCACAVPELAVSRLPSLVVDRLGSRRNLAEQRLSPQQAERVERGGKPAGGSKLGVTGSSPVPPYDVVQSTTCSSTDDASRRPPQVLCVTSQLQHVCRGSAVQHRDACLHRYRGIDAPPRRARPGRVPRRVSGVLGKELLGAWPTTSDLAARAGKLFNVPGARTKLDGATAALPLRRRTFLVAG